MKKLICLSLALFFALVLNGCCERCQYEVHKPKRWIQEDWMRLVNTNPKLLVKGADRWFFNGEPNADEHAILATPESAPIVIPPSNNPRFTRIVVHGGFQVQLVGGLDHNSVSIGGSPLQQKQLTVNVTNDILYVYQNKDSQMDLHNVIVRIGIHTLNAVVNNGNGAIYGRSILSKNLLVESNGDGTIMLEGHMNLTDITQTGNGTIAILGAYTPCLSINMHGAGNVGISGRVGVRYIMNSGGGCLNIIGADTDSLCIDADGSSTTAISGCANVRKIEALDKSRVYLYWVKGANTFVIAKGKSRVGLAGTTQILHVNAMNNARFEGQRLKAQQVFIKTHHDAHANVYAMKSIFASAQDHSVIYFFGPPNALAAVNPADRGNVITMYAYRASYGLPAPCDDYWNRAGCPIPLNEPTH